MLPQLTGTHGEGRWRRDQREKEREKGAGTGTGAMKGKDEVAAELVVEELVVEPPEDLVVAITRMLRGVEG